MSHPKYRKIRQVIHVECVGELRTAFGERVGRGVTAPHTGRHLRHLLTARIHARTDRRAVPVAEERALAFGVLNNAA